MSLFNHPATLICGAAGSGLLLFLRVLYYYCCYIFSPLTFQKERCQQAEACRSCKSQRPTGQMEITSGLLGRFPGRAAGWIPGQQPSLGLLLSQRRRPAQGPPPSAPDGPRSHQLPTRLLYWGGDGAFFVCRRFCQIFL